MIMFMILCEKGVVLFAPPPPPRNEFRGFLNCDMMLGMLEGKIYGIKNGSIDLT